MNFDFPDGAEYLQFLASNSGFSGDGGGILKAFLSTDEGSSWIEIGDEIVVSNTMTEYNIPVSKSGPVRFRVNTAGGGRISIDDVYIESFTEILDDPTISVRWVNDMVQEGSQIKFPAVSVGTSKTINLSIRNNGEPDLEVSNITLQNGEAFLIDSDLTDNIETGTTQSFSVSFSPQAGGSFTDLLTIHSNDPDTPEFQLNLKGSAISSEDIIPISQARELPIGTSITVTGWITVRDEFSGPVYFQDETGGMAWYNDSLMRENGFDLEAARGDSIVITGELGEFGASSGQPGTGLLQIVGTENDIEFSIYPEGNREINPSEISIAQLNSGEFEGQLIRINNFEMNHSGAFQGGTNYRITDQTGEGEFRVDQQSNVPGSQVPAQPMDAVGVAGAFAGIAQIIPRDTDDLDIVPFEYPGEDISKDLTFDVVTWNIEWFGNTSNGPVDTDLQMNNVIEVIKTIDADLYALQEISNEQQFFTLVDSLDEYTGFWADYIDQTQKMAYLYKFDIIESVNNGGLMAEQQSYYWGGRLPLIFEFNATVGEITRRIFSYNIHAKAMADLNSYDRRVRASTDLKLYLDNNRQNDNVIIIGDYNDKLTTSTYNDEDSPYANFVIDENYYTVTKSLEEKGLNSYIAGQFRSMIDHITVTNDLIEDNIEGAQRVENPSYIGSYITTTSDHAPVWTRFDFTRILVSNDDKYVNEMPERFLLHQNYPNPFNPSTNISFQIPERSHVTLKVYNVMGHEVASLAEEQSFNSGSHTLSFNASNLSSGMYIYRLKLGNGLNMSRKMILVK